MLSRGLMAAGLLAAIAGCGHDTSNTNNNGSSSAKTTLRLSMRVLDGQTGAPVSATLTICGFGAATADSSGVIKMDINGLTGTGSNGFSGRIDAAGYAAQSFSDVEQTASDNSDGDDITIQDEGVIFLNRARTLNVVVSNNGVPVAGAAVVALLNQDGISAQQTLRPGFVKTSNSGTCQVILTSTTNGSGVAQFQVDGGTSSGTTSAFFGNSLFIASSEYHILVPAQNLTGGPGFDFATTEFFDPRSFDGNYFYGVFGDTISIAVQPSVDPQAAITPLSSGGTEFNTDTGFFQGALVDVSSTASPYGQSVLGSGARSGLDIDVNGDLSVFSADGSVTLTFETPVTIISDPSHNFVTSFTFRNALTTPVDLLSTPPDQTITGTATVVPGTFNTMWTLKPPSSIPLNAEYFIEFYATTNVTDFQNGSISGNSQIDFIDTSDEFGFYYHAPAPTSIAYPTLDNYNGTLTNSTPTATAPTYLEFSEQVTGSYVVLGITDSQGNVENDVGDDSVTIGNDNQNVSMVFNVDTAPASTDAQLGATAGTRFRIPLEFGPNNGQISLEDGATVVVAVNVVDAKGNRLNKTFQLTVK